MARRKALRVQGEPVIHRAKAPHIKDAVRERRRLDGWHLKGYQLSCHPFHLDAGHDKRADSLVFVGDHLFAHIVLVGTIPVGLASQAGDGADAVQVHQPLFVHRDKLGQDAVVALPGRSQVFLAQVAHSHSLGHGIDKHARRRGLEVVARSSSLVEHLVPHTAGRVLDPEQPLPWSPGKWRPVFLAGGDPRANDPAHRGWPWHTSPWPAPKSAVSSRSLGSAHCWLLLSSQAW